MKKIVIIALEIDGFHFYPEAPKQVKFLKEKHRHTFKIKIGYKVSNLNREKEIFIMRDEIKSYLFESYGNPCQFEEMSCEMIASEILEFILTDGGCFVEVWEEETGGARIEI